MLLEVNVNLEDLSSLAARLGGQREEHSGEQLAARLESLEAKLTGLTSEDGGRLVSLEDRVRSLQEAMAGSDNLERRWRRQRRVLVSLKTRLDTLEAGLGRDHCQELSPCRNGGSCVNTFNSYFCQCPDTWEGATCEQDVDECARNTVSRESKVVLYINPDSKIFCAALAHTFN